MKRTCEALKELLKEQLVTGIKCFQVGRSLVPPKNQLPILMVYGTDSDISGKTTGEDQTNFNVTIEIVANVAAFMSDRADIINSEVVASQAFLYEIMQGTDEDGKLLPNTVASVIRANIRNKNWLTNNKLNIKYSVIPTGNFFYINATMTLNQITDMILRPDQNHLNHLTY